MRTYPSNLGHRHVLMPTVRSPFEYLARWDGKVYRKPDRCDHTRRRWRGGFHWDCLDCGEPVRDVEDKTQTTFSSMLYTETHVADPPAAATD